MQQKCYHNVNTSGQNKLMNYPRLIKRLRTSLFLSQSDLAEILGTNKVSVSRWENGKFLPSNKYKKELYVLFKKHIPEDLNRYV